MKTHTKLRAFFIILLCAMLCLAWITHHRSQGHRQQKQNLAENSINRVREIRNFPHIKRLHDDSSAFLSILSNSSLKFGFTFSRGRTDVRYVLGLTTLLRKGKTHLLETLEQLIGKMNRNQRRHCIIVVHIGETNKQNVERIFLDISDYFGHHLDNGLINVISPPSNYYPDSKSLYINSQTRKNLDCMFLMKYAKTLGDYYIQLDDDANPKSGYMDYIDKFRKSQSNTRLNLQTWIVLDFSELDNIGKLLQTQDLGSIIGHVKIFYKDQPMDWLLQSFVKLKTCRWDSFHMLDCARDYYYYYIRAPQSQFKSFVLKSDQPKIIQELRDNRYNRGLGKTQMRHLQHPFNLVLSHMNTMLLESKSLKNGETFLWAYMPQESSFMRFLKSHQYGSGQIKIRGGAQADDNFSEVIVDMLDAKMALKSEDIQNCGFLLSYSHQPGDNQPDTIYYYMNEMEGTSLFRRFSRGNVSYEAMSSCLQVTIVLWFLLGLF